MELTVDVPEGYEATGEWRCPKVGEHALNIFGQVFQQHTDAFGGRYLILRPKWKPPTWLKEGTWIAMDRCGEWFVYEREPEARTETWHGGNEIYLSHDLLNFTPPPCTDWRESKRQIRHG